MVLMMSSGVAPFSIQMFTLDRSIGIGEFMIDWMFSKSRMRVSSATYFFSLTSPLLILVAVSVSSALSLVLLLALPLALSVC